MNTLYKVATLVFKGSALVYKSASTNQLKTPFVAKKI